MHLVAALLILLIATPAMAVSVVVAAADSHPLAKQKADLVCDGTEDQVELLRSITMASKGKFIVDGPPNSPGYEVEAIGPHSVEWLPGNYHLGHTLHIPNIADVVIDISPPIDRYAWRDDSGNDTNIILTQTHPPLRGATPPAKIGKRRSLGVSEAGKPMSRRRIPEPEWSKYTEFCWGFAGMDLQQVTETESRPAVRTQVAPRSLGLSKGSICRLANGDLLVAAVYGGELPKQVMRIFRSRDEGLSWTMVRTRGARLLGKEPALQALNDGVLVLLTSHPHGFRVHRSEDGGVTWTMTPIGRSYEDEGLHWDPGYHTIRNVLEQPDGSLAMVMSMNGPESGGAWARTWLFRSTDRGRTWQKRQEVKSWRFKEAMFAEASFARLADGRILAVSRTRQEPPVSGPPPAGPAPPHEPVNEADNFLVLTESKDNGLTWSTPRAISNYAEVHGHLLALADGRLMCTYASYHFPYGVFAMFSENGGKTWDRESPTMLAYSLTSWCGWPTSIQLPGGDIITYYVGTRYQEGPGLSLLRPGSGDNTAEVVRWKPPANIEP